MSHFLTIGMLALTFYLEIWPFKLGLQKYFQFSPLPNFSFAGYLEVYGSDVGCYFTSVFIALRNPTLLKEIVEKRPWYQME